MEIRTLSHNGELFPETLLGALNNFQTEKSLREHKKLEGNIDTRSGGISFLKNMDLVLQFEGSPPLNLKNEKEMVLLIPPGKVLRVHMKENPGWTIGVTPSGNMIFIKGSNSKLIIKKESIPDGVIDKDGILQRALDWEFEGYVCHWSQQIVDNLVRKNFRMPPKNLIPDQSAVIFSASSFNRSLLLLELIPELNINDMKTVSPFWNSLVANWSEIKTLFDGEIESGVGRETNNKIKEVLIPIYESLNKKED